MVIAMCQLMILIIMDRLHYTMHAEKGNQKHSKFSFKVIFSNHMIVGVNLNHIDNISKQTALFYAAREGHVDICRYLIENGADYQIQDQKRQTALNYAKKFQRKAVIEYLQQINFQNKEKKK